MLTRWDCRRYAREAYEAGVRYFGGCCGFEPYHIREVAEEVGQVGTMHTKMLIIPGNSTSTSPQVRVNRVSVNLEYFDYNAC